MSFYSVAFVLCGAACLFLKYEERRRSMATIAEGNGGSAAANPSADAHTDEQRAFQQSYLIVYVCAFFADWLKGKREIHIIGRSHILARCAYSFGFQGSVILIKRVALECPIFLFPTLPLPHTPVLEGRVSLI